MLATAAMLGVMGSLHCVGMCGPIAFMLPLDRKTASRRYGQLALYHLGRMLAYGLIGLVFGLIGKGLYLFGFQQKLSIVLGAVMIAAVLIPSRYLRQWKPMRPWYRWMGRLQSALGTQLRKRSQDTFLTIGLLNGLLPCGLVYMALIGAMAMASASEGAFYMMAFGLGTVPLMSAAALMGKLFKGTRAPAMRKIIPVFVVVVGLLFILRGMGLGIPYLSPDVRQHATETSVNCHP